MAKKMTPVTPKKSTMKKNVVLKEVPITATRIRKTNPNPTVRLYPKGEASKKSVDSLINKVKLPIGKPMSSKGVKAQYGAKDSDLIKSALKKK